MEDTSTPRLTLAQTEAGNQPTLPIDSPASIRRAKTMTLDAHIDIPWQYTKQGNFSLSLNNRGHLTEVDFPRMKDGGLDGAIFALYLHDKVIDENGKLGTQRLIGKQLLFLASQTGCVLTDNPNLALESLGQGLVPIFLGLESGRLIHDDLSLLTKYRSLGVRYLTVTHNRTTSWADSATDLPKHNGINNFGKSVVHEANRLGILMDVSHGSDDTARQVLMESTLPVIASHSGARTLVNHPRNLSDELLRRIAVRNGVVCVPFARRFVGNSYPCVVDHIDYISQKIGTDHVGIGSDLDGAEMPQGIRGVEDWKKVVTEELFLRGFSDQDIENISGGNLLRVLSEGL